jgi:hypothetical protein
MTLVLLVSALCFSCGSGAGRSEAPAGGGGEAVEGTAYEGVGTIVEIRDDSVVIDGDAIPGFMEAMEMDYPVSDPALLDPFEQGMVVKFRVVVNGSSYVVDRIEAGAQRQGS